MSAINFILPYWFVALHTFRLLFKMSGNASKIAATMRNVLTNVFKKSEGFDRLMKSVKKSLN